MEEYELFKNMFFVEKRLQTFQKWPITTGACIPKKLASAGFYKLYPDNDDDAVKCFSCCKELDGWVITDDPMKEHKNHSQKCPYMSLLSRKKFEDLTVEECIDFETDVQIFITSKHHMARIEEFKTKAKETEKILKQSKS